MSGGIHLRDLASGQHSSEKTPSPWRAVGDTVFNLTDLGIEPSPLTPRVMFLTFEFDQIAAIFISTIILQRTDFPNKVFTFMNAQLIRSN